LLDAEAGVERMLLSEEADPRQSLRRLRAGVEPEHPYRAGARLHQADREPQECCLARPVWTDERRHRPAGDLERAALQRPLRAVTAAQPLRFESRAHATFLPHPPFSQ